jgi:hypothetical protein
MGLITWIIVIIVFLAILGPGWDTFFSGVKKGADRIGIGQIVDNTVNITTGNNGCKECISGNNGWIVGIPLSLFHYERQMTFMTEIDQSMLYSLCNC